MSFGFGIGDVITAISALVKACEKIASVPNDIFEASKDLERLLTVLKSIGKATIEKTSIVHRDPGIKDQLVLDIKEVAEDVKKLRNHLRVWKRQEERPPLHGAVQRFLFAFYTVPEVKEIRANFTEYRDRLSLMLHMLSIAGHNEARKGREEILKGQNEILIMLKDIKARFSEDERRKESRLSLVEDRTRQREERYLEWQNLGLAKDTSSGQAAELRVFLEEKRKALENGPGREDLRRKHLDEVATRLSNFQVFEPLPQFAGNSGKSRETEAWASSVASSTRCERRNHRPTNQREDSRADDLRTPRTPVSKESASHMAHSQSSASLRSRHQHRSGSSRGSDSRSTSRRGSLLAAINPWFQPASSTGSRRASAVNSSVQSSVGTPTPGPVNDAVLGISALLLEDVQDTEGWSTVPRRAPPTRSNTTIASGFNPRSIRSHQAASQTREQQFIPTHPPNILCVNWDNTAFSRIAQTYFELLRLWTINTSSHWPFDRVEAAGFCMNTDAGIDSRTDIDSGLIMELLAPPRSNFRSRDFPNEKDRLLNRMFNVVPSKFRKEYLAQFRWILCFDNKSYGAVAGDIPERLKPETTDSQVRCIHLELDHLAGRKLSRADAENAVTKIKVVVEGFMEKRLGWKWPDRKLVEGQRRTLQISFHKKMKGAIIGTGGANIKDMRAKLKCAIQIFDDELDGNCALILATGHVQDLESVEKRIKEVVPSRYYWS